MSSLLCLDALVCERDGQPLFGPISLTIEAGEGVELVGKNGSGKSTLLRTLAGLHTQYSGHFTASDLLYQGHLIGLDPLLTVLENLQWFSSVDGDASTDLSKLFDLLDTFGLLAKAHTLCHALSAGQQRRLAMVRWTLSSRKLWLLDEPITALDEQGQGLLLACLQQHCAAGGAVLYATHAALNLSPKTELCLQAVEDRLC